MRGNSHVIKAKRDHGGGVDAAVARFGGTRETWIDLSTGINPEPFTFTNPMPEAWTALPDTHAMKALVDAARRFWSVPDVLDILPVPGASAAIAQIPRLAPPGLAAIPGPTYNEHAASFAAHDWDVADTHAHPAVKVIVHPNNPTGHLWTCDALNAPLNIVDESFCDICPEDSLLNTSTAHNALILKSFGKFWGLAGLRLGFVIGPPSLTARLAQMLGPWSVSGVALDIGTQALNDHEWAVQTRANLQSDAARLDDLMTHAGAKCVGGCDLFRLYSVDDAATWQTRLAQHHIWSRIFPYSQTWLRLGLPPSAGWSQLEDAL